MKALHAVRAYKRLTSPFVLMVWLAAIGGVVIGIVFGFPALLLLSTGVAVVSGLLFAYGLTYWPFVRLQNASNQSFATLSVLREHATVRTPESLLTSLIALGKLHSTRRLLQRLDVDLHQAWQALTGLVAPQLTWEDLEAQLSSLDMVTPEDVLSVWLLHPVLHDFWRQQHLRESDVRFVIAWYRHERLVREDEQRWWNRQRLLSFTGLGLSWTSGYTPLVDQLSFFPRGDVWDMYPIGREQQIQEIMNRLAQTRGGNVLLVGQPGTGRLGVVKELERRLKRSHIHPALVGMRMLYVHVGEVIAQSSSGEGQLTALAHVLHDIERGGNCIVVLDGLGSILGQQQENRTNMADVLLPFFSSQAAHVIVIVSSEDYHLRLAGTSDLAALFDVVQLDSLSPEDTLLQLALTVPALERHTGIFVPYQTLRVIVDETVSILPSVPFPQRAFLFLNEAITEAQGEGYTRLEPSQITKLIARKVGVDVGVIGAEEQSRLLNLEDTMHQRVVNQRGAITAVAHAMMRARAGVRTMNRPIGTFLFLGPTGVGKTETAKALAEAYFGHVDAMTRFDMSEFNDADAVSRLIGSAAQPVGRLTAAIADKPFTVLLLDEFEKASSAAHQLFLQALDEGMITDVKGQHISFKHVIIIATSNAGAEFIREAVQAGPLPPTFSDQLRDHVLREHIFRPELLNRFDGIVTFTPLTPEHIAEVATMMLRSLNKRLDQQHGVTVAITPALVNYLVERGYNPEFGARPMARAIQDTVEYAMASRIIRHQLTPGQQVVLQPSEFTNPE